MRRRDLLLATLATIVGAAGLIFFYGQLAPKVCKGFGTVCEVRPEFIAAILAAAGGLLAVLFQWRSEFVATLREVWRTCLEGYAEVRALYRLTTPDEADFQRAIQAMSIAIDDMRSVYRNVGENERYIGLYPYASLHDIRLIVHADQKSDVFANPEKRRQRVRELDAYWRNFRLNFLDEFRPQVPDKYVIGRLKTDNRREGLSPTNRLLKTGSFKRERLLTDDDIQI